MDTRIQYPRSLQRHIAAQTGSEGLRGLLAGEVYELSAKSHKVPWQALAVIVMAALAGVFLMLAL